ncbi:MAG: hypothetical protein H8D23_35385, partial [Candidatus Brocadiales bacterium]|nr:hypothetical protein [Candidatus Brocadiales bacterium]
MSDSRYKWFYHGARVFFKFDGENRAEGEIGHDKETDEWYLLQDVKSGNGCDKLITEFGYKYSWLLVDDGPPEDFRFNRGCNEELSDIQLVIPWLYPYAEIEYQAGEETEGSEGNWYNGVIVQERDTEWCVLGDVFNDYDPRREPANEGHFTDSRINKWRSGVCLGKFNAYYDDAEEWLENSSCMVDDIRLRNVDECDDGLRTQGNFKSGDIVKISWGDVSTRGQMYYCPGEQCWFLLQNHMSGVEPRNWAAIKDVTGWGSSWAVTDKQTSGPITGMAFISEGSITIPGRTPEADRAARDAAGYA